MREEAALHLVLRMCPGTSWWPGVAMLCPVINPADLTGVLNCSDLPDVQGPARPGLELNCVALPVQKLQAGSEAFLLGCGT